MRTYKEQTALILEKVNQRKNEKKKRMKYIYSFSTVAACFIIIFSAYTLLPKLMKIGVEPPLPISPTDSAIIPTEPNTGEQGGGEARDCVHYSPDAAYSESYHRIDIIFTYFIYDPEHPDKMDGWIEEAGRLSAENATEQCKSRYFTIDFFIEYFDIKREDFEKLYYKTYLYSSCYYDIDILYSGDKDLVERYYAEFPSENIQEMESRRNLKEEKDALVKKTFGIIMLNGETVSKEYEAWVRSLDKDNIIEWFEKNVSEQYGWFYVANSLWSIPEFLAAFDGREYVPDNDMPEGLAPAPAVVMPDDSDSLPPPTIPEPEDNNPLPASDNGGSDDKLQESDWKISLENFLTKYPTLLDETARYEALNGITRPIDADGIYVPGRVKFLDLDSDDIPEVIISYGIPEGEYAFNRIYKLYGGSYEQIGQVGLIEFYTSQDKLIVSEMGDDMISTVRFAEIQNKILILSDFLDSNGIDNLQPLTEIDCSKIVSAARIRVYD